MSGHKSFKVLRESVVEDPERRARVEKLERTYDAVLELADLRESLGVTQTDLAELLEVSQPNVSKIEHKDDVYLSTLKSYISALGGRLELKAVFPNRSFSLALPGETKNQEQRIEQEEERRAFGALTEDFLSFQRRNAEVARGWTDFLKVQESTARAAQDLFTTSLRIAKLQQRNISFAQKWMDYDANIWRDQAESNAHAAEVLAQSAAEQQESFRKLAEQSAETYENFLSSLVSYAEEGFKEARQIAGQTIHQGLEIAQETVEQTERTARQADPNRLPIEGYDELNVSEVSASLDALTAAELKKVKAYERRNKNRETVIEQIERKITPSSSNVKEEG